MRTNYKDFIPTTELRKYTVINNADGTVSLQDVTTYEQEGDRLRAEVLNELSQNANWQLTHAKSSTTHALTGLSDAAGTLSCVFTATADYAKGDTFTVDGESYTVKRQNGEEADDGLFVTGAKVGVIIDTEEKSINFAFGGGVTRDTELPDGSVTTAKFAPNAKAPFAGTADYAENAGTADYAEKTGKTLTATIPTSGWSASAPYSVTVAVSGILSTDAPIVDVVLSNTADTAKAQLEAWANVGRITTADGSITVYCYEKVPTTAIPIQLKVVR